MSTIDDFRARHAAVRERPSLSAWEFLVDDLIEALDDCGTPQDTATDLWAEQEINRIGDPDQGGPELDEVPF